MVLAVSALVAISALVIGGAVFLDEKQAWALLGFEVVTLAAGVLGVFFGLGRFRQGNGGAGLGLACIAGTILVAAVLGMMSVTASAGESRRVGGIPLVPVELARVLGAFLMAAGAAWVVLAPERRAWKPAVLGAVLGAPVAGVALGYLYPGTRGAVSGLFGNPWAAVAATLVLGGLLAASVHLIVRAFEIGTGAAGPDRAGRGEAQGAESPERSARTTGGGAGAS